MPLSQAPRTCDSSNRDDLVPDDAPTAVRSALSRIADHIIEPKTEQLDRVS
jgi:hypothetical protein